jgi:hypothetical protein
MEELGLVATADAINRLTKLLAYARQLPGCKVSGGTHPINGQPTEYEIMTPRGEWGRLRVWEIDYQRQMSRFEWDCVDDNGGWVDLTPLSSDDAIKAVFKTASVDLPTMESNERLSVPKFDEQS